MMRDERLDIGKDAVLFHAAQCMRDFTRKSSQDACRISILNDSAIAPIASGMVEAVPESMGEAVIDGACIKM